MEKQRLRRQLSAFEADAAERERSLREEEARRRADANAPLALPEGGQSLNEFLKNLEPPPVSPEAQP